MGTTDHMQLKRLLVKLPYKSPIVYSSITSILYKLKWTVHKLEQIGPDPTRYWASSPPTDYPREKELTLSLLYLSYNGYRTILKDPPNPTERQTFWQECHKVTSKPSKWHADPFPLPDLLLCLLLPALCSPPNLLLSSSLPNLLLCSLLIGCMPHTQADHATYGTHAMGWPSLLQNPQGCNSLCSVN